MTTYQYTGRSLGEPQEERDYSDEVSERIAAMDYADRRDWGYIYLLRCKQTEKRLGGSFSKWLQNKVLEDIDA